MPPTGSADFPKAFVQILPCCDWFIRQRVRIIHALRQATQIHMAAGMQEKRNRQSGCMPFRARWIYHPVGGRLEVIIGEALEHITHVYHNFLVARLNIQPVAPLVLQLQAPG